MAHELTEEQITAASMPLTLVKDGEELELQMFPLKYIDYAELNNWLRKRILNFAYNNLPEKTPENLDLREEIIGVATRQAAGMSWHSVDGIRQLETSEGIARLVWQCCRGSNPSTSEKKLRPYFDDPINMQEYSKVFKLLNPELMEESTQELTQASEIEFPELSTLGKNSNQSKGHSKKKRVRKKGLR